MKFFLSLFFSFLIGYPVALIAQGPPILTEKTNMLGQGRGTVKLAYLYSEADRLNVRTMVANIDYNLTPSLTFEIGMPVTKYIGSLDGFKVTDLMIASKYQYFKEDIHGKTFRMAAKLGHSFYLAKRHAHLRPSGTMVWGSYGGFIAGMESLTIGVICEAGFSYVRDIFPKQDETFFQGKLSIGVPLLKRRFPVRQINVYLESELTKQMNAPSGVFYLAPGIQYVHGALAIEMFYQPSIISWGNNNYYTNRTLGGGIRFIY